MNHLIHCPHCGGSGHIADPGATLVLTIAEHVAERAFTCRELLHRAHVVDGPLRAALGDMSARRLGKTLHRLAGLTLDGVRVERIGFDRDGAVWRVLRV